MVPTPTLVLALPIALTLALAVTVFHHNLNPNYCGSSVALT